MHASSAENMAFALAGVDHHLLSADRTSCEVLDLGSMDVNGSYRSLLTDPRVRYTGADLEAGPGVDLVLDDPNHLPFEDASFDLVLSGQMLEHAAQFWVSFAEMRRVLRPDGVLIVIAPSSGPIHSYPVDCYRFYPDAYRTLAALNGLHLLSVHLDERGPWKDLVGVFSPQRLALQSPDPRRAAVAPLSESSDEVVSPETEVRRGAVPYLEVLDQLHQTLQPAHYLEIGVRRGASLALARCRGTAIDPDPDVDVLAEGHVLHQLTSDAYFREVGHVLDPPPELCFIDGLHVFEQALRDVMNCERASTRGGVLILDDVLPNHPAQAARTRSTTVWSGDVWKIVPVLRRYRPDLDLQLIDADPCGLLIIRNLDPDNRVLWESYNPIVREWSRDLDPPAEVLERVGAAPGLVAAAPEPEPLLSVVVLSYDMERELPRTLRSLSPQHQLDIDPASYEIIVVDNGSTVPPQAEQFADLGCTVRVHHVPDPTPSPAAAANQGLALARAPYVGVLIDGARMASPRLLSHALAAHRARPGDVVASHGFHLGSDLQFVTIRQGYDAAAEDAMLAAAGWEDDGYRLFDVSVFASSSAGGWLEAPSESNAMFLSRDAWERLGGFDEQFISPGGGLVNLDLLERALEETTGLTMLIGEGTFHQVHGGVATNARVSPWDGFAAEYAALRGRPWVRSTPEPRLFGRLPATPSSDLEEIDALRGEVDRLSAAVAEVESARAEAAQHLEWVLLSRTWRWRTRLRQLLPTRSS